MSKQLGQIHLSSHMHITITKGKLEKKTTICNYILVAKDIYY
jgi:hypothetical protein